MAEKILEAKGIVKTHKQSEYIQNRILNQINLDIYQGDFTVIMGASGAGKSTLLYALSGMDSIDEGEIYYKGKAIHRLSEKKMVDIRIHDFGFVFQQMNLVSNLTVEENLKIVGFLAKQKECDKRVVKSKQKHTFFGS